MFEKIVLSSYRFILSLQEELTLPSYLGSTLRGGFGGAFRRICCLTREAECKECILKEKCPYAYIFCTAPPSYAEVLKNLSSIPRPYILEPPPPSKRKIYEKGSQLAFNLTLIGKAREYLPYFIVCFKEFGNWGIGKKKGKFWLESILARNLFNGEERIIYSCKDEMVKNFSWQVSLEDAFHYSRDFSGNKLRLHFTTPTRLKFEESYQGTPEFHILMRALLRRLSSLAVFHCGVKLDVDYKNIIAKAQKIRLIDNHTRWVDWERYSSRQRCSMKFGGIIGEAEYEGDNISLFLPYIIFGEFIHLGKNTTFGLGRYEVIDFRK